MAKVVVVISTDEYQNTTDFREAVKSLLDEQHLYLSDEHGVGIFFTPTEHRSLLDYRFQYRFVNDEMVKLAF